MKIKATVLIPTFDHGPTLSRSVQTALNQTVRAIEVLIVGDGVSDETRELIGDLLARDDRVRFFDHPKGPRHGERYRHEALARARGEIVCYLADDDLWLPDHVERMGALLENADFAHTLPLHITPDGEVRSWTIDFSHAYYRELLLSGKNRIPLSAVAHTTGFYRRLPHGWRTTPEGLYTDLYMWQQFLSDPDCRLASGTFPSLIHFPSSLRQDWTLTERLAELDRWTVKRAGSDYRELLLSQALHDATRERASLESRLTIRYSRLLEERNTLQRRYRAMEDHHQAADGDGSRLLWDLAAVPKRLTWRLRRLAGRFVRFANPLW